MALTSRPPAWEPSVVAIFFLALTLWWTWPLPTAVSSSFVDAVAWEDARVNSYILAESMNALSEHPWRPLDGRFLYPHARTLAYSENLLTLAALSLPARGYLSVLTLHNILLMLGIATGGFFSYYYLRRRVTLAAALFGSVAFAIAPFHLCFLGRLQLAWTGVIPFLFLLAETWVEEKTWPRSVGLGAAFAASLGMCMYFTVHATLLLAVPVAFHTLLRQRSTFLRTAQHLVLALTVALALAWPLLVEYGRLRACMHFGRTAAELSYTSGLLEYFYTVSPLMTHVSGLFKTSQWEDVAYPGIVLTAFALLGLASARFRRSPQLGAFGPLTHLYVVAASTMMYLGTGPDSIGQAQSVYGLVANFAPFLSGMRYPRRFIVPLMFGLSYFGALGVHWVMARLERSNGARLWVRTVPLALLGAVIFEFAPKALVLRPADNVELVYSQLPREARDVGALVELPMESTWVERSETDFAHIESGVNVVNGYSGFEPYALTVLQNTLRNFPDAESHAWLRELGVNRVLLHKHRAMAGANELASRTSWLRRTYDDERDAIFDVVDVPSTAAARVRERIAHLVPPPHSRNAPLRRDFRISSRNYPTGIEYLSDGDTSTSWSTAGPQLPNQIWFQLNFPRARTTRGLAMSNASRPTDFPCGVSIQAHIDGHWVEVARHAPYIPIDQLIGLPALSEHVFRFSPITTDALRIISVGERPGLYLTLDEAWPL